MTDRTSPPRQRTYTFVNHRHRLFGKKDATVINHPPYSPDLTPTNFFSFPKIKLPAKGTHCEETKEAIKEKFSKELKALCKRCTKRVVRNPRNKNPLINAIPFFITWSVLHTCTHTHARVYGSSSNCVYIYVFIIYVSVWIWRRSLGCRNARVTALEIPPTEPMPGNKPSLVVVLAAGG